MQDVSPLPPNAMALMVSVPSSLIELATTPFVDVDGDALKAYLKSACLVHPCTDEFDVLLLTLVARTPTPILNDVDLLSCLSRRLAPHSVITSAYARVEASRGRPIDRQPAHDVRTDPLVPAGDDLDMLRQCAATVYDDEQDDLFDDLVGYEQTAPAESCDEEASPSAPRTVLTDARAQHRKDRSKAYVSEALAVDSI